MCQKKTVGGNTVCRGGGNFNQWASAGGGSGGRVGWLLRPGLIGEPLPDPRIYGFIFHGGLQKD